MIIKAMQGAYRYKRLRLTGSVSSVYDSKPDKQSEYSHIADALQYACLYILRRGEGFDYNADMAIKNLSNRRRVLRRVM